LHADSSPSVLANEKNAKLGQRGSEMGDVTYFEILGPPPYLGYCWS